LNFGSLLHLDSDLGIFEGFFNIAKHGTFPHFGIYLCKSNHVFMTILLQTYLSTSKSPLNFVSHPDPHSGSADPERMSLGACLRVFPSARFIQLPLVLYNVG